jgi:peptide/nickel transport system ATP-binding protein
MVLKVENLNLWYGKKQVLFDIDFVLSEGEILCIVGESGSGKSSILNAIAGLLPQGATVKGVVSFKGVDLLSLGEKEMRSVRGKEIGMIFQEPSSYLDPLFTAGSQVEETLRAHLNIRNYREETLRAFEHAGIPAPEEKYGMYPHQLSGGLKQRVCIASAIVCDPSLILADEPTTALDVSVQKRILSLFRKLRDEGKSIILVTHDFGVVAEVADRVIVLKNGKIVEEGDVFAIFDSPRADYTKELLSAL